MSNSITEKIYRNPARKEKEEVTIGQYVPQYQLLSIKPKEYVSTCVPGNVLVAKNNVNDNSKTRSNGSLPNVGNNIDHNWCTIDGDIIDNISDQVINNNTEMIDNNDFIDIDKLNNNKSVFLDQNNKSDEELKKVEQTNNQNKSKLSSLKDNSYILLVKDNIVYIGSLEKVQEKTRAFIFDEQLYDGYSVSIEDILILKKVKIKIGLFLE